MLLPDPSIDVHLLGAFVAREFGAADAELTFMPVGGDSWSYRAGPWWVSVRRDRQGHAPAAYEAARELRDAGYEFVAAPVRGRSGRVVNSVGGRPVVVTEYVEGRTSFPDGLSGEQLRALAGAVESLHAATVKAPVPKETFDLPFMSELDGALARALAGADSVGPLGPEVSALVRRSTGRLAEWRREIASCQAECRKTVRDFVLTHAEPDPPNVMITTAGRLLLFDWGDLLWAPPERDARALRSLGIDVGGRAAVLRFYELRWILSEVAEYVDRFTVRHTGDAADLDKWRELRRYLTT
ncbi:MAG: aminoglycoside phosphotransferase family protein [Chloroflexi bacterium]|nr:MAG: aminoglycoside phosphotransferase family protein [Chloroflexota bacterium]